MHFQYVSALYTETYRSGHNGTDSKSVVPSGTVGSNPTVSAKKRHASACLVFCAETAGFEQPVKKTSQCEVFKAPR